MLDSLPIKFCSKNLCRKQFLCIEEENEGSLTTKNLKPDSNLDDINNKYTFVYLDDRLVILGMKAKPDLFMFTGTLTCTSTIWEKGLQYQYVTWEESDASNNKYYFSDREGSILDSPYNETLQNIMSYYGEKQIIRDIILPNISKSILLSSAFAKVFAEDLTENQLEVFANTLNSDQLQALKDHLTDKQFQTLIDHLTDKQFQTLIDHLTDEQLQTLVDHLTNHQLQTLAQELNPEKLQIIVPILNDAQLEALVRDLNPEQVKEILPHLKVDQFKALIKTLNDEQFTVLAKDLAEHHLTILSKELEGDQLKALVNSLQEDQLKDLVNKLDPEKLEAIAQDLTDSNRIQMIIKSLADNPEKLQAFARNMSNEQFKELLDNIGAEELKDIIHKLPHEKVISVIGDLGSKDHSNAIIDVLKEKFNEQNEKMKDLMSKVDRMLPEESEANWNDAHPSTCVFQDVNAEFAVTDHLL